MISLGGVALNDNMIWADRHRWSPVAQSVRQTLGGAQIVYSSSLMGGRPITLVAVEDQGWLTLAQLQAVQEMADQSGAVYTLVIDSESYQVVFKHDDPPALEFSPLIARATPVSGDFFIGVIKLMTV